MSEAAWALFEGSYHVEALDHERLGDGDGLKLLCWQVHLPSVELASLTPMDDLLYLSQHSGPIKTLSKGFSNQRPRGRVMSVDSGMDLEEELLPLVGVDALHEHPRWTPFVEFITKHNEGLGASSDASGFSPFGWEILLEEVGE